MRDTGDSALEPIQSEPPSRPTWYEAILYLLFFGAVAYALYEPIWAVLTEVKW